MLDLPKPKRFRSLSVRLVRFVNVCFPDFAYEFGRSVQSQVSISGDNGDKLIDCKKVCSAIGSVDAAIGVRLPCLIMSLLNSL